MVRIPDMIECSLEQATPGTLVLFRIPSAGGAWQWCLPVTYMNGRRLLALAFKSREGTGDPPTPMLLDQTEGRCLVAGNAEFSFNPDEPDALLSTQHVQAGQILLSSKGIVIAGRTQNPNVSVDIAYWVARTGERLGQMPVGPVVTDWEIGTLTSYGVERVLKFPRPKRLAAAHP